MNKVSFVVVGVALMSLVTSCGVGAENGGAAESSSPDEIESTSQELALGCYPTGWGYISAKGVNFYADPNPNRSLGSFGDCYGRCSLLQQCNTSSFFRVYCEKILVGSCITPNIKNGWIWAPNLSR